MKCERCGKAKVLLLTTWAECDCVAQRYPELAEGGFFWIDSEVDSKLPKDSWWCSPRGGWVQTTWHQEVDGRNKHLYALPGKRPTHAPVNVPVLNRPPFGAWGDRFYIWEHRSGYGLLRHEHKNGCIRSYSISLSEQFGGSSTTEEYRVWWGGLSDGFWSESGTTRQAALDWLREMEAKV